MSLHRKVASRIINLRSGLISLRSVSRSDKHRSALVSLIADVEALMDKADKLLVEEAPEKEAPKRNTFPFDAIEIGGFFEEPAYKLASLRSAASSYGRRHGMQFTVKLQSDGLSAKCFRVK